MREKLKFWLGNDQIYYGGVIILVGLASFGLGRASVEPVELTAAANRVTVTETVLPTVMPELAPPTFSDPASHGSPTVVPSPTGAVVGSRSGQRYHLPTCPGAKQIKPENLVTFPSRTAAEAAGYTAAANCPGL